MQTFVYFCVYKEPVTRKIKNSWLFHLFIITVFYILMIMIDEGPNIFVN